MCPEPVRVLQEDGTPVSGVAAIAAGLQHVIALKEDGTLLAWGANTSGELGRGTTSTRELVAPVLTADGRVFSDVVAVAAGTAHSVAIRSDRSVWAWGGLGAREKRSGYPVRVRQADGAFLGEVEEVAAGMPGWIMALKSDGTVWVGRGELAQVVLPDGTPLTGIAHIDAWKYLAIAVGAAADAASARPAPAVGVGGRAVRQ
jgi:alpha-tubulin suppressor-like RCC1 family protein